MPDAELHDTVTPSRRGFLRLVGASTATAAVAGTSLRQSTQPAKAFTNNYWLNDTLIDAGDVALDWMLREFTALTRDEPPTGLTGSALKQSIYETCRTRKSTNASTLVDNRNIIQSGLANTLYVEGKLAGIEALNAGKSQSEVQTQAVTAKENYLTTIQNNFLDSYVETVEEWKTLMSRANSHSDVTVSNIASEWIHTSPDSDYEVKPGWHDPPDYTLTLDDGSTRSVTEIPTYNSDGSTQEERHIWEESGHSHFEITMDQGTFEYFQYGDWNTVWNDLVSIGNTVGDGLITWIDAIYGQVQSGEISISDLVTPRERAAMMTDDGTFPQAVADLLALNVPVDLEREAKVTLDYTNGNVTLNGSLAISSPPAELTPGTYDPATDNLGTVYLTYDVSEGTGVYESYDADKGVDGGVVEFEATPPSPVTFRVHTNFDEVAEFPTSDLTKGTDGSGNTVWTVDVSGQLENQIASIDKVTYVSQTDETQYETIQIKGQFTIESFTNTETGESADSASFESSEPQDDTNYITQSEWDELQAQNERLIQAFEDSQTDSSSGGGGGSSSSGFLSGEWMGVPKAGWALVGLGGSLLGYELFSDDDDHGRRGGGRY